MPETPRPWVVFDETTIVSPQGDAEAGTWLVADCRWKDDAALIVRAVNSHDRLLAALKGVMGLIADGILVRDTSSDFDPEWAMKQLPMIMTLKAADTALAQAEGLEG